MENKTYCKCKKCGYDKAEVNTSVVLDSYPPMYKYRCLKCGLDSFIPTNEVYGIATINTQPLESRLYGHCLICGEEVATLKMQGEVICDECKEAIKWAKEQKQDWKKAFELTKAQEEVSKMTIHSKPFWCDQPCLCAECKKAVECAERYNEQHIKTKEIDATHLNKQELILSKLFGLYKHCYHCPQKYDRLCDTCLYKKDIEELERSNIITSNTGKDTLI